MKASLIRQIGALCNGLRLGDYKPMGYIKGHRKPNILIISITLFEGDAEEIKAQLPEFREIEGG